MSHSPVIGQDVSEATNGVDSPTSPDISDRPTPRALKCDSRTLQDDDFLREGTQTATETRADSHHISNNLTPHPNSDLSCTEVSQARSTSLTDTHPNALNTYAESPLKRQTHASEEDLSDSVFSHTDGMNLTDPSTKGRPHTEAHSTDRLEHDSRHTNSGALLEDGVREEEVNNRRKRTDSEQGEEEKAKVNIQFSLDTLSTSSLPDKSNFEIWYSNEVSVMLVHIKMFGVKVFNVSSYGLTAVSQCTVATN